MDLLDAKASVNGNGINAAEEGTSADGDRNQLAE
jgi:hypothetical protein